MHQDKIKSNLVLRSLNQVNPTPEEQQHMTCYSMSLFISQKQSQTADREWETKCTLTASTGMQIVSCSHRLAATDLRKSEHLCKSRCFGTLPVWSIQLSVNRKLKRKEFSDDLREAIIAAHQCCKGYNTINLAFIILHLQASLLRSPWTTKSKSSSSDRTDLS